MSLPWTTAQALEFAQREHNSPSQSWFDECGKFNAMCRGYQGSGWNTAADQGSALNLNGDHTAAPVGAVHFWGGGAGHVALDAGGGMIWSNDIVSNGNIDKVPFSAIANNWGKPYMGWADGNLQSTWSASWGNNPYWNGSMPNPVPTPTPAPGGFTPFPGAGFFVAGHTDPIIGRMHDRLIAVGCNHYTTTAGKDTWDNGDVASYSAWQQKCGYSGSAADGIPGQTSWDKLQVPLASPTPPPQPKTEVVNLEVNGKVVWTSTEPEGSTLKVALGGQTITETLKGTGWSVLATITPPSGPTPTPTPTPTPVPTPAPTGRPNRVPISVDSVTYGHVDNSVSFANTVIPEVFKIMGITDPAAQARWKTGLVTAASRESSFDFNAVNTTDSNATGPTVGDGNPANCSRGVLQCIPPTFADNHQAGTSTDIYDGVANTCAAMNYVHANYGVSWDASNLASNVQQFDPNRPPRGY